MNQKEENSMLDTNYIWSGLEEDLKSELNSKIGLICIKKCLNDYDEPTQSLAQKSCLSRCTFKFYDSLVTGENMLNFLSHKINLHNQNVKNII